MRRVLFDRASRAVGLGLLFLVGLTGTGEAAGFREQTSWQFRSPSETQTRLNEEALRLQLEQQGAVIGGGAGGAISVPLSSGGGGLGLGSDGTTLGNQTNTTTNVTVTVTVTGDTGYVGDHQLLEQVAGRSVQERISTILAKGAIFASSSASVTNLANVADITGEGGGQSYGDILRLDQYAVYTKQVANNWAAAGSVNGIEMEAVNGVNIANFDLSDMAGAGDLKIKQKTYNVTQNISNGVQAHGAVTGAILEGTNLGNVVTFAVEVE